MRLVLSSYQIKDSTKKKKIIDQFSHELQSKYPQQNVNKPNLATYKNNYTPWPNGIYFKYAKLVQHLKKKPIVIFHHRNVLKNKNYMLTVNWQDKSIWRNSTYIHDNSGKFSASKSSWKIPQLDK